MYLNSKGKIIEKKKPEKKGNHINAVQALPCSGTKTQADRRTEILVKGAVVDKWTMWHM